jgi:hypothetical protein
MELLIERINDTGKQTIGRLFVLDENNVVQADFPSLELSWKNNSRNISCIPKGTYTIIKRTSAKFGTHLHVLEVQDRSYILIHKGNYYTDIRGCILIGMDLKEINNDKEIDVINSTKAMKKLIEMMPNKSKLKIVNGYGI